MHTLIVGGDSNLGTALYTVLTNAGHDVICTSRRRTTFEVPGWIYMDLRTPEIPQHLLRGGPQLLGGTPPVVYIMAAVTGIMRCETDPDAWRVNAEAPLLIAQQARAWGWRVVSMSSGTVERAPHTASAGQKAYADMAVLLQGGCVVRPLPYVEPEEYVEVANLLMQVGVNGTTGVVRWHGWRDEVRAVGV